MRSGLLRPMKQLLISVACHWAPASLGSVIARSQAALPARACNLSRHGTRLSQRESGFFTGEKAAGRASVSVKPLHMSQHLLLASCCIIHPRSGLNAARPASSIGNQAACTQGDAALKQNLYAKSPLHILSKIPSFQAVSPTVRATPSNMHKTPPAGRRGGGGGGASGCRLH